MCHAYGPDSPQAQAELIYVLELLESGLFKPLEGMGSTLLLIGADHGQTAVDPARTIYLNQLWPDIASTFKSTRSGRPIVPGG
ncbi:MAG: alkaline phosphatase family protein, partial [Chloroflexota bacterium]